MGSEKKRRYRRTVVIAELQLNISLDSVLVQCQSLETDKSVLF